MARRTPRDPRPGPRERILEVVREIPRGRVATYGQVAALAGMAGAARQVGWALAGLPEGDLGDEVPWHRVINARGEVSERGDPEPAALQRAMLEAEGVEFDPRGRTDLERYRWEPDEPGTR